MNIKNLLSWSKKTDSVTVTDSYSLLKEWLQGIESSSGVQVNHRTALQAGAAIACARVIAEGLAQIPLKLMRTNGNGAVPAMDNPLYRVLHDSPNEYQTAYEWREMMALHLVFAGNAYNYIVRDNDGNVWELLPLMPTDIEPAKRENGYGVDYFITRDGKRQKIDSKNILHLKGATWNGVSGLDGVEMAKEAIGLSMATEKHGAKMFKNGATIPGVISTDNNLNPEQVKLLRESFEASQVGLDRAWNVLLLWGGLKYQKAGSTGDESQLLETRAFQVEEVCRHFRVMPIMVGHSDKAATYASAEQMFLAHVVHTMGPWYSRLEQAFNKYLIPEEGKKNGLYTKFVTQALLRGTHSDRANYYNTMFNIGALSPNDIRRLEDLNPYEGGNDYRVPMNTETPGEENGSEIQPD